MIIEGELTPFLNTLLSLIFDDEEGSQFVLTSAADCSSFKASYSDGREETLQIFKTSDNKVLSLMNHQSGEIYKIKTSRDSISGISNEHGLFMATDVKKNHH